MLPLGIDGLRIPLPLLTWSPHYKLRGPLIFYNFVLQLLTNNKKEEEMIRWRFMLNSYEVYKEIRD